MTQIVFLDPELERELCQRDPTVKATDIYRILQDELLAIFQTNVGALKKEYIRKRQVEDFDNLTVAAIRFLEPKKSVDI